MIGWLAGISEADTYFTTRFGIGTRWTALSDANKTAALTTAYNQINYSDQYTFSTYESGDTIPQALKDAQCEQALYIIIHNSNAASDRRMGLQAQGIRTAGVVQEDFGDGIAEDTIPLSHQTRVMLRSYRRKKSGLVWNAE